MPCGKKRKKRKMNTHKRKKRLRADRHKKKKQITKMKPKSFAIWANPGKKEVPGLVHEVVLWAKNNDIKLFLPDGLFSKNCFKGAS